MLLSLKQMWHKTSHRKEIIIPETTLLVTCFWIHEPQYEAWYVFENWLHSSLSQSFLQFSAVSKHCFWISIQSHTFRVTINNSWSISVHWSFLFFKSSSQRCKYKVHPVRNSCGNLKQEGNFSRDFLVLKN